MGVSEAEKIKEVEEGPEALAAAMDLAEDDGGERDGGDDASTSSTLDLRKLIHAEVVPPKSLVLIWILFAAELGFDLITTAIAFFSTIGKQECCGYTVYLGPLPMTTTIPFFFLIVTEIVFLGRAILLTLWPSVFEARRLELHGGLDEDDDNIGNLGQVGFEVTLATTEDDEESGSRGESDSDGSKTPNGEEPETEGSATQADASDAQKHESPSPESREEEATEIADEPEAAEEASDSCTSETAREEGGDPKDRAPEFIDTSAAPPGKEAFWKRACCCLLRWNARVILMVLNFLTLLNPFFGCLIAYILLYQSDKTECFVVLGIESLSIVLHFVSVRMEGGLRTVWSRALHSLVLLPFFVTVILVLVFLREGGMCYSAESRIFLFSGCEICPDTEEPPIDGMCGNSTLEGAGGLYEDLQDLGSSFASFSDLQKIANIAKRGAEQGDYCSEQTNFCFFEF